MATSPVSRRTVLKGAAASLGVAAVQAGIPVSLAQGIAERPLVVVLLRGGLDGLALTPPWNDPDYAETRGRLALAPPGFRGGILDLTNDLGLHPAAAELVRFWRAGQLRIAPTVATAYRGTDPVIAQGMLDGGLDEPSLTPQNGWLYRALSAGGAQAATARPVSAAGPLPLLLRGAPSAASSWQPPDLPRHHAGFFAKASTLYANDPTMAQALNAGTAARGAALAALSEEERGIRAQGQSPHAFPAIARRLGDAMVADDGPKVAVVELNGWDTFRQQGATGGALARRIGSLAGGLSVLADRLGPMWSNSTILVLSAHGRSATPNATGGTDNGVATTWLLLSGGFLDSRRVGASPRLAKGDLLEDGAVAPSVDARGLLAAVLKDHWKLSDSALSRTVFPGRAFEVPADF